MEQVITLKSNHRESFTEMNSFVQLLQTHMKHNGTVSEFLESYRIRTGDMRPDKNEYDIIITAKSIS